MGATSATKTALISAKGKLKLAVGKVTRNRRSAARGRGEQAAVRMREAADGALEAAEQSAADLQGDHNTLSPTVARKKMRR